MGTATQLIKLLVPFRLIWVNTITFGPTPDSLVQVAQKHIHGWAKVLNLQ
jgi:hypothetical protein